MAYMALLVFDRTLNISWVFFSFELSCGIKFCKIFSPIYRIHPLKWNSINVVLFDKCIAVTTRNTQNNVSNQIENDKQETVCHRWKIRFILCHWKWKKRQQTHEADDSLSHVAFVSKTRQNMFDLFLEGIFLVAKSVLFWAKKEDKKQKKKKNHSICCCLFAQFFFYLFASFHSQFCLSTIIDICFTFEQTIKRAKNKLICFDSSQSSFLYLAIWHATNVKTANGSTHGNNFACSRSKWKKYRFFVSLPCVSNNRINKIHLCNDDSDRKESIKNHLFACASLKKVYNSNQLQFGSWLWEQRWNSVIFIIALNCNRQRVAKCIRNWNE